MVVFSKLLFSGSFVVLNFCNSKNIEVIQVHTVEAVEVEEHIEAPVEAQAAQVDIELIPDMHLPLTLEETMANLVGH